MQPSLFVSIRHPIPMLFRKTFQIDFARVDSVAFRSLCRRLLITLVERVSLTFYMLLYASVVIVLAGAFFFLTPHGNGLISTGTTPQPITFGTALYFSLITICTVGYGDVVPVGFARALACFEAVFGVSMVGIILAKITSARLSHHVSRLFGSDAEDRLDQFRSKFQELESALSQLSPLISQAFPETPAAKPTQHRDAFLEKFGTAISAFESASASFCRYLKDELSAGFFFSDAPAASLARAGAAVDQVVFVLSQVVIALGPTAKIIVLTPLNRRRIADGLEKWRDVSPEIINRSEDAEVKKSFNEVAAKCVTLTESFFSVPVTSGDSGQPDQVVENVDQPQG